MAQDPLKFLRDRQGPTRAPLLQDPKAAEAKEPPQPQARAPEPAPKPEAEAPAPQRPPLPESKPEGTGRLIVGPAIRVKGEIGSCDTLVVQGEVEASMAGRMMEVAKGGLFKGQVELQEAAVAGRVEGKLTVKGLLRIASGGEVRGEIRYGELEIEKGGLIAGDIGLLDRPAAADEEESKQASPAKDAGEDEEPEEKSSASA
jgi:cytoskeletal protein CcmA (bactofilin family)